MLEGEPEASDQDGKKACRRGALERHPDKVAHLGEQLRKDAADKFKKVKEVWEPVKKERGIS